MLMSSHGIHISERHLRRLKRRLNLRRVNTPIETVSHAINHLYQSGYNNLGNKAMWRLLNNYGIQVQQEVVRKVQKALDPMSLIHKNLDELVQLWNMHRIRSQRHSDTLNGIPNMLYNHPEVFGAHDYSSRLTYSTAEIDTVSDVYTEEYPTFGCRDTFLEVIELLTGTAMNDFLISSNIDDALMLYRHLTLALDKSDQ
ncbi:unnamed protein product [Mytilus coruscus]|uniref:Uncharacterized protein n=1 Tax=Mytilus coruscus TaxID=42192 RepID=A0A6J8BDS7_MYTCO|nr:unnamed protein product [Mytilus coruscus]